MFIAFIIAIALISIIAAQECPVSGSALAASSAVRKTHSIDSHEYNVNIEL